MTLPARVAPANKRSADTPLPLDSPIGGGTLARIQAGLDANLTPLAFRLHTAMAMHLTTGVLYSTDDMARVSGLTEFQCRPLAKKLVDAGLLTKRRVTKRRNGVLVADTHRYALAVIA